MDVGSGILKGFGRERASSPIGSLQPFTLINGYAQQISGEGCQAKLGNASETGGDAGIEYVADMKSRMPVKTTDIVVCRVNDFLNGNICQNVLKWSEVGKSYRIDDVDLVMRGNLYKAELLGVMVKAVGLCIKSYNT